MVADRGANARLAPDHLPARARRGRRVDLRLPPASGRPRPPASPRSNGRMRPSSRSRRPPGRWSRRSAPNGSCRSRRTGARRARQRTRGRGPDGPAGTAAARALGERYHVACVKLGARGRRCRWTGHRGGAAEPITEVDPTGAGDAFDGVLLAALARGEQPGRRSVVRATPGAGGRRARTPGRPKERRDARVPGRRRGPRGPRAPAGRGRPRDERDRPRAPRSGEPRMHERMGAAIRARAPCRLDRRRGRRRDVRDSATRSSLASPSPASPSRSLAATCPVAVACGALGATTVSATCGRRRRRASRSPRRAVSAACTPGTSRRERRPLGARTHARAAGVLRAEVDHRPGGDRGEARGAGRRARGYGVGSAAVLPGARYVV